MLRQQSSGVEPNNNGLNNGLNASPEAQSAQESGTVDIQQELNRLEEMVLASPRIPFTGRTLVDEEKLLDQLDFIRLSLPGVFQESAEVVQQKQEIIFQAEEYGQKIVDAAETRKAQILDQSEIIRQAEREAERIRLETQQECEAMMQETLAEIDHKRRACQQEIEELRQRSMAEAQQVQNGADEYADGVLLGIEEDLHEMLNIITNGRQQLYGERKTPLKNIQQKKK
jgi:hypothetical protein